MTFLFLFTFFFTIKILESLSKFPSHLLIFVCPFYCPSTSTASLFSTLLAQLLFVKNQLISACIIKLFFFSFLCKTNHMKKKNKIKKPQYFGRSQISVSNLFLFFIFYFIESLNLCSLFLMIFFLIIRQRHQSILV